MDDPKTLTLPQLVLRVQSLADALRAKGLIK